MNPGGGNGRMEIPLGVCKFAANRVMKLTVRRSIKRPNFFFNSVVN